MSLKDVLKDPLFKPVVGRLYVKNLRPAMKDLVADDQPESKDWNDVLYNKLDGALSEFLGVDADPVSG